MGDVYNLEKALDKKQPQEEDNSLLQEAQRIEEENYHQADSILKKTNEAKVKMCGATETMKEQTEKLESAKGYAIGAHKEARKGEHLADEIDKEGHIFRCRCACLEKLVRWFKRDAGDDEVKEIENRKDEEKQAKEYAREEFKEGEEFVPGQNKTDKKLYGVLDAVRGIREQVDVQNAEAQKQKTAIKDIGKVNEHTDKVLKRTDEHLKKID